MVWFAHAACSREIAELTGKRHDHVMADIRNMFAELEIQSPEFSGHYKDSRGRLQEEFNLPKDLTFTLVLGYDVKRRYAVTRRWLELEEGRALTAAMMAAIDSRVAAALTSPSAIPLLCAWSLK